jgi:3-hydroxyacyl-[acyl-carrier-protein] dehydratase
MLKDDLYTIQQINEENNVINVDVELNELHEIFKGHFPGQPVLPGVCMLQMVRELFENFFNKKLQLSRADDIRFLAMIDPTVNKKLKFLLQYKFDDAQINVNAKILKDKDVVCCKMKATFKGYT